MNGSNAAIAIPLEKMRIQERTVLDLPLGTLKVQLQFTVFQGRCSQCRHFETITPPGLSPNAQATSILTQRENEVRDLSTQIEFIDILINAVGFLHSPDHRPEKSIKELDLDFFNRNVLKNTLPSILLAKHFMKAIKSDNNTFFLVLSAKIGSIADNKIGGWLSYRTSKAALNIAIKTISIEWKQKIPNCCVLLFHPGTTDTKLSEPFQKSLPNGQVHNPEVTANSILKLIKSSSPCDSGKFISFDGNEILW